MIPLKTWLAVGFLAVVILCIYEKKCKKRKLRWGLWNFGILLFIVCFGPIGLFFVFLECISDSIGY
jgi:bacteriorhodopsin